MLIVDRAGEEDPRFVRAFASELARRGRSLAARVAGRPGRGAARPWSRERGRRCVVATLGLERARRCAAVLASLPALAGVAGARAGAVPLADLPARRRTCATSPTRSR